MRARLFAAPLALVALGLGGVAIAQSSPPSSSPPAAPAVPGGMMARDPFGDATIPRKDAEAQAAARFAALDADKDGTLSPAELTALRPGRPDGRLRPDRGGRGPGWFGRIMDADGNGKVSRDEFITGSLRRFDVMDADHDGQLTKAERQTAMEAMRARMEQRMQERLQGGGDGPMGEGD